MTTHLIDPAKRRSLADTVAGLDQPGGNQRVKQIIARLSHDLFAAVDELDIQPNEIWAAADYLTQAGQNREYGLVLAVLGLEHYLDLRQDAEEARAGHEGGTPRTIEGPLYVGGAPVAAGEARLDDGTDQAEVLFMSGQVRDLDGRPLAGAVVDVWHADSRGNYSHFDAGQSEYNLRRRITTGADGRYRFRSIMPVGYAIPPGSRSDALLRQLGRHGNRPAHIHFFVSAPGYRHLTTQINIDGDAYLHDDVALATRDDLIPPVMRIEDPEAIRAHGLNSPFSTIAFDFVLAKAAGTADVMVERTRVNA